MTKQKEKKDVKAVSAFLKERMTSLGISRRELAGKLGMKYVTLNAILIRNKIPRNRRAKFAKVLGVMIEKLNELHKDRELIYCRYIRRINLMPLIKNLALAEIAIVRPADLNKLIKFQEIQRHTLSPGQIKGILTNK